MGFSRDSVVGDNYYTITTQPAGVLDKAPLSSLYSFTCSGDRKSLKSWAHLSDSCCRHAQLYRLSNVQL